ncbi:MAG: phosphomannomutase/phosphoglucomutase [Burkholderiaceae bacterium]|nr:phosphomannomutase/phosphoglucomutase [Burkholderiaceae bacterium]
MSSSELPKHVFKAYDIRGEVPADLNPEFARLLGRSLAARAKSAGVNKIVIGYDGRLSSPDLANALGAGIREGGVGTIELGLVPTPLVYFAAHHLGTGSGVAITGSHNPPQYNGFKMMLAGSTLYGEDITSLRDDMSRPKAISSTPGQAEPVDIKSKYLERVTSDIKLARPMKIAIDCGNGVAGVIAADLYRALGCEVIELFCEVDGQFPNHHPDPAEPHNLQDLIKAVQTSDCELGLAFDGDGDRLGVVTRSGEIIWPDRQMILFARDILSRLPASQILFDVKCSRQLPLAIKQAGGEPLMCRTGHSLVKAKLAETGAPLAGEMSGHIFFKERWFGFDDGLYTGARLLEILSRQADSSATLETLPTAFSTPELKLEMKEGEPFALIDALKLNAKFIGAEAVSTIDGIRVDFADGFGLARPSNTTPVVVLRFEGETPGALDRIKRQFRDQLQALAPHVRLPF